MIEITNSLAKKLIAEQFPEYSHMSITSVKIQGHDNRTYRLGNEMLIRIPSAECYALKVPKEQEILPKLAKHLSFSIPIPIHMGQPSSVFPLPFSIYKWLAGESLNCISLENVNLNELAFDLAKFLKELQKIDISFGPTPGQHNWWRGNSVSVYDDGARSQIAQLREIIDSDRALNLWERACATRWTNQPVWIHGDIAIGNVLVSKDYKLSGIIDFGVCAVGDPACDLVIAWTLFEGESRRIFMTEMNIDENTWLREKAWTLWKFSFELCEIANKSSEKAIEYRRIINEVLNE